MLGAKSRRSLLLALTLCAALPLRAAGTDGKPMKMDEPMKTGMMKPGMKVGDVKKAAEKRARELDRMLEKESASEKGQARPAKR